MSWLFSSPGSVLATQIWRSFDGYSLTTVNLEMSPPNSSSRFTAHGEMKPVSTRAGMPYFSSRCAPIVSGSNRPSGLSKIGLVSWPALST